MAIKPIAVFRHVACEGPGYLYDVLARHNIDCRLIAIDAGEIVPTNPGSFSGLIFLGGPMSVNDPLKWINQELELIRKAHLAHLPILGHCLGAQLIAKALGATVKPNPDREIGWFPITQVRDTIDQPWLHNVPRSVSAFHWHGETFDLPDGAVHLWRSNACVHQGFAIGNTLALQFHAEITPGMIDMWTAEYTPELSTTQPWVQSPFAMASATPTHLQSLRFAADAMYSRWLQPVLSTESSRA